MARKKDTTGQRDRRKTRQGDERRDICMSKNGKRNLLGYSTEPRRGTRSGLDGKNKTSMELGGGDDNVSGH
jgi:hypothetical protein